MRARTTQARLAAERRRRIAEWLAEGMLPHEIMEREGISESTYRRDGAIIRAANDKVLQDAIARRVTAGLARRHRLRAHLERNRRETLDMLRAMQAENAGEDEIVRLHDSERRAIRLLLEIEDGIDALLAGRHDQRATASIEATLDALGVEPS